VESFPLWVEDSQMPKSKPPYPAEFRARMIDLVRSGRSVRSLSRKFGVTETTLI
jgi:transposase